MSGGFSNKNSTGGSSSLTASEILWVQSGSAGVLKLGNISGTPSTITAIGQVYTKISDGLLYYLSGAGVEYNLTTGGSGSTYVTPTGTIDRINRDFTLASEPKVVFYFGTPYFKNVAGTDGFGWNNGTLTLTMPFPPQPEQVDTFKAVI